MKEGIVAVAAIIGISILFVALLVGIEYLGLINFGFFAPRYQAVERSVFEETPSFIEGKEQELTVLRTEYNSEKDAGIKSNMRSEILNVAAAVDINKFKDASLIAFIGRLRSS